MFDTPRNALAHASSTYLRAASHQQVQWQPWGADAFAAAIAGDKPILLDVGAVWAHWCSVMDRENYNDPETAAFINEHFLAIRVDRDEHPDIDARYQAAVSAISGQGGWPLTVFLAPDGRPFFGGTYFPSQERYGQPGFRRVLQTMAASFYGRRDEVEESASSVMDAIEYSETFTSDPGDLSASQTALELSTKLVTSALDQLDPVNGGFGSQPKFLQPAVLDLLIATASRPGAQAKAARQAAQFSLQKMAAGGVFDQLAGGFHRYAVDERWIVPRFEKMSYDNADILRTYVHAFHAFRNPEFADTAFRIVQWMDACLADRERGGFFAAQTANAPGQQDGSYYTWTRSEAAAVLDERELRLAEMYFDIGAVGDLQHDPTRNVLFRPASLEAAAAQAGIAAESAQSLLQTVEQKLYAARLQRTPPPVDKAMYTGWNAMCISAYIAAARILRNADTLAFARKSLDRILAAAVKDGQVSHVVSYGGSDVPSAKVAGLLDDYVFLGHACLDLWETTGEGNYYTAAEEIGSVLAERFSDDQNGGFFDTEPPTDATLGALRARRKPLQDAPTPAGNPNAAALLLRLYDLNGEDTYRSRAQGTLECFANVVEHLGLNAATFGLALLRFALPAVQVIVVGTDAVAEQLEAAALERYQVNRSVVRLRVPQADGLPRMLAAQLNETSGKETFALVCIGQSWQPLVETAAALRDVLDRAAAAAS